MRSQSSGLGGSIAEEVLVIVALAAASEKLLVMPN